MKMLVITGSPHRDGTSALMADYPRQAFELGKNVEKAVSCQ